MVLNPPFQCGLSTLYFYCTFPCDDLARDTQLLGQGVYAKDVADYVNWVDMTKMVSLEKVNVCRNLARNCTCMHLCTRVHAFSTHASYYFTDDDWDQIFKFTSDIRVLQARVFFGQPVDAARWHRWTQTYESVCTSQSSTGR